MPTISLKKSDLPFLLAGAGEVSVDTGDLTPTKPIDEGTASLLNVAFSASGQDAITFGQGDTVKLGLSTSATVQLTPIFSTTAGVQATALKTYGIPDFFKNGANTDKVVLCFEAAAAADGSAAADFRYSALKASLTLAAGADAGYAYLAALDKGDPLVKVLQGFFQNMRLPEQGTSAPQPGEAVFLQYGGYLRLGAEVSAGYELSGTKAFSVGQLALSEKYDLSIVGKIGLSAGVAGHFSILVTAADRPGWCRVQVRRQRSKDLKIAADVNVGFKNELDLPSNASDFLGALLGVNAKSFLTVFKKAGEQSDSKALEKSVDGLAKKYIEAVIGKGFDALSTQTEFKKFLAIVNRVGTSYEEVEDRAVTLFDRYFEKLDQLTGFLNKIQSLSDDGLTTLRKDLSPELWTILSQLTDGDPLGFLLQQVTIGGKTIESLSELKNRAQSVLDLIQKDAHAEIRRVIGLAKQQFGFDRLMDEVAKIDTIPELQALANEKVGLFITRLVGRPLDSANNLKQALDEVRRVLTKIDGFSEKLFAALKDAANNSYKLALNAEYSRASETQSLLDVAINLAHVRGPALLAQAGKGDFDEIVTTSDTDVVRLVEGVFTHRTRRDSAFKVNVIGWHLNYSYDSVDKVIVDTEQRLVPSEHGITVLSMESLEVDRKRKRQNEQIHVNFLLRAIGESAKVVKSDPDNQSFIIDALSALTASYQLEFTDDRTEEIELADYLSFAASFGLDVKGATLADLRPLLPRSPDGTFGEVSTKYDVRFGAKALAALISVKSLSKANEAAIRSTMRLILLSNYLRSQELHDVAFSYASAGVFDIFREEGAAQFTGHSARTFPVALGVGIAAPSAVTLSRDELEHLATLFNIENGLIDAIRNLFKLLGGKALEPAQFEKALGKFGSAMKDFDDFDQTTNRHGIGTNTIFVIFDALVRLGSGGSSANTSVLRMTSKVGDRTVEKLFLSDEAANPA